MSFVHKIILALLISASLMLYGCVRGPNFETGGFTETFMVPVEKGRVEAKLHITFAGLPSEEQTILLHREVRPIILDTIKDEARDWPTIVSLFEKKIQQETDNKEADASRGLLKTMLCERIKRSFRNTVNSSVQNIARCLVMRMEKLPT